MRARALRPAELCRAARPTLQVLRDLGALAAEPGPGTDHVAVVGRLGPLLVRFALLTL